MVVYLDIIWILNLLIDSLLLWITSIFLKRSAHPIRIILGGVLGSLLILMAITPFSTFAAHPIVKLTVSIVMMLTVFGYKKFSSFISCLLTFYFATFLMGGILIGVHYFLTFNLDLKSTVVIQNLRGYGDPVSWLFLILVFPIAWHFSRRRVNALTITNIQYDVLINVTITINGIILHLKGLIDSGNQLYDPITKTPVMIVSIQSIRNMLPPEVITIADDTNQLYDTVSLLPKEWSSIMRLIPAKSLGKNNQLLCAFKPDKIDFNKENGSTSVNKALIVFTSQTLSKDESFQCIIHPYMTASAVEHPAS
ncbi:sigma-E processing peptidase SpoIIGA [Bacillus sp. FJAT-49732]|uniref:Sporulation sigma-E factor-processing peptidase n=1 Tax=Lederbergia citrisecunda TaxID=2833583 RepID=A0A942YK60_9BACI|nr:sigma-E processing peptidase SpoIIGA [Lederbergia citrisecunda]MBS4198874.1 sigma-E processing peptidase SpoIIGA [Lederbergia citrisecunda]